MQLVLVLVFVLRPIDTDRSYRGGATQDRFYVLPHRDNGCSTTRISHPVTLN